MTDHPTQQWPDAAQAPAWLALAWRALRLAVHREDERALRVVERMATEHGPQVIPEALQAWLDAALKYMGPPPSAVRNAEGHPRVALAFYDAEAGVITDASQVRPETAWAGQLLAARAAMDREMFVGLVDSVPDDDAWSARVSEVLCLCAGIVRANSTCSHPPSPS